MRRIFIKIFLLFLLSSATIFILAYGVIRLSEPDSDWSPGLGWTYELAHRAVAVHEKEGVEALRKLLRKWRNQRGVHAYLLTVQNVAIGPDLPAKLAKRISRYPQFVERRHRSKHRGPIGAVEISSELGNDYRFIAQFKHLPIRPWWRLPPGVNLFLLLIAITIASVVIALLMTRPLARIKSSTTQFASGDLSARTPHNVAKRRDAIGELSREFDHMAATIQSQVEGQRRLLRDVSHELRSPLARMQVAATLAEDRGGEGVKPQLQRIQQEIEKLNQLIGQLISLNRFQSGALELNRSEFELSELLNTIGDDASFEYNADRKRVNVIVNAPTTITADKQKLSSAFENIIRNGLRYTEPNTEVEVTVSLDKVDSSMLAIVVQDHGPGVEEKYLERIFEPFFRPDTARNEKTGSHGVGLAIARAMIELNGGSVNADNATTGGLTVRVKLPITPIC